jgi:hypothetical protein
MAKKSATKAPVAPKETKAAAPESPAPKADATSTESTAPAETSAPADAAAPAKKSSGSSRPISYFSSVSTDEYRAGWADIFGKSTDQPKQKAPAAKRASKLPVAFELEMDDLDAAARDHLEALVRLQAKKQRLNYDKLAETNDVTWQITCHISE